MNHQISLYMIGAVSAALSSQAMGKPKQEWPKQPNVIYIMADDLGIGDVEPYGQNRIHTPNLKRMQEQGMRFTQCYAGTAVSAPSRCSLMTGLHTGHAFVRGNKGVDPEGQVAMPEGTFTMATMFKESGYATGCFGKWGLGYADYQWTMPDESLPVHPQNLPYAKQKTYFKLGFSPQTRFWIDDMYMMTFLQAQAYRVTRDMKYSDRMCTEAALYIARLQRPDGLFDHAPDVPYVWGRGDGWVAGGMAFLIEDIPFYTHEYPDLLRGYLKMMKALKKWQRPSGLWGQLVDDPESWDETSGSAMFASALAAGVNLNVLDAADYAPAVRKAYLALVEELDANGNLRGICEGTVKKNDRDHYLKRPTVTGAPYGQAAMLWLCKELIR